MLFESMFALSMPARFIFSVFSKFVFCFMKCLGYKWLVKILSNLLSINSPLWLEERSLRPLHFESDCVDFCRIETNRLKLVEPNTCNRWPID